ncbi:MAG TPA: hypothetical protein DDW17_05075 [Deltaproteobacteria bacterium]|nr:hypothetical protein [Deltaproteobacteria bacterium]
MKKMIYMASTKISEGKTIGEITTLLAKYGASGIVTQYENGKAIGLAFSIKYLDSELFFKLPVRYQPVLAAMRKDKHTPKRLCNEDQARRVAWRQILRWIEAQLALISVGMVDIKGIFMPYLMLSKDETLYERLEKTKFPMLQK